jgi:small-conductance mechanosensitive channel
MDKLLLGIPVSTWIIAAGVFVAVAFGVPVVRGILRGRCPVGDPFDRSWRSLVGRLNARWMRLTTLIVAGVCAVLPLSLDLRIMTGAKVVLIVALTVQFLRLVPALVDWSLLRLTRPREGEAAPAAGAGTLSGLRWLILLVAYTLVLLLAMQNMGVDVTSLIAGLGIGGIAVALAMQNILGDLFASLTITLDKPFIVGDFIIVGNEMGVVEHVGLKTTRVRSLSGEQLVFGNADLLASRIRNYKRMRERRVVFGFGVVYATPPETLEAINAIVRGAIETQADVRFDRCHFHRFGASSLDFEAVYYINSPDYNAHMDAQQAVHLGIARAFRERAIEFAFPTQTIYLARTGDAPAPR